MSLFAIADLHLSLGTDKPMDVFSGWTDYVERLKAYHSAPERDRHLVDIIFAERLS